ncbi:MAG: cytidylate kinase-like family protein [Deltaproteobacteria bacterium]|nr:cytidylate kinase-like family protein [Deltaproteobacteria bacterium]MBW1977836.1 cytidylate kinase-like family protein [Deltaproteobacteria bacterium]MBW2044640.1 cytidylate kinase-like family protein [Deltaproteobacteria bacterium]MBW2298978.1 cytidylate kinase-like family protein [Deltaproteobacteria bacterium]
MGIITISRGSYSKGKEIAEKLAQNLGYQCVSRDILIEASESFNVPEIKLIRALHDSPSVLERFTYGKERYISYIRKALLEHVAKDNVIYHGLAGHFFLKGVPHVLKVRIIANMEDRVKEEMKREKISEKEARYILRKDDEERRKWGLYLYGIDTSDASLYDVVLHIDNLGVDDAVEILAGMAKRPCFQTTPESKKILSDLLLAARAHAALVNEFPTAEVTSRDGVVYVNVKGTMIRDSSASEKVVKLLNRVEGIKEVKANVVPVITPD